MVRPRLHSRLRLPLRAIGALVAIVSFGPVMRLAHRPVVIPAAPTHVPPSTWVAGPERERVGARFALCNERAGTACIVDGDTIHYDGRRIRVLGIDTPELHPARCAAEAVLGEAAKVRLQELINSGPFDLVVEGRDTDTYGRQLRRLIRHNSDLGLQLVTEGLARPYGRGRRRWC